jgi:Arc/MetJ-type ribon-helix-helix transcriptional regulator
MNIEIHKPELEQRVLERIQSGRYHDAEELLTKALDALREKEESAPVESVTGAALLAVLQASPYPEIDLMPRRERLPVRDVTL